MYLGRLVPQFYTITHNQLEKVLTQNSVRRRREETLINKKTVPLIHKSADHRIGISFGNIITIGNWGFITTQNKN